MGTILIILIVIIGVIRLFAPRRHISDQPSFYVVPSDPEPRSGWWPAVMFVFGIILTLFMMGQIEIR